jgi:hypothetical protein
MNAFTVTRGNVWGAHFVLTMPGDPTFVWTGIAITAQLRLSPDFDGQLLHTFAVSPILSTDLKTCEFSLALSGAETLSLADSYGDFRVERISPQFGPFNIFQYRLTFADNGITN